MRVVGNSLLLTAAIAAAATSCFIATFSHAAESVWRPAVIAALVTWQGVVPPLWFASLMRSGPSKQLVIVAVRAAVLFPSLMLAAWWEGVERKCFLTTLLACYFIAVPLESWLLIRDVRRSGG